MRSESVHAHSLWIGGGWYQPSDGERFESIDPTTGTPYASYAAASAVDVDAAVRSSTDAVDGEWRELSASARGALMIALADRLGAEAERIAETESRENGKLIGEMRNQATLVPDWLRYFGGLADKIEGRVIPVPRPDAFNYTVREPLGVVGVITPWNSPLLLTVQAAAPALAAGNSVVIKPSEVTPGSALILAELATEVGFPAGVINVVTGLGPTGRALAQHTGVAKIVFTGGAETGQAVHVVAAERGADAVLELGGKSPNIVFADADLDGAAAGVVGGVFGAGGQSCTAGSRALIEDPIYDEMIERIVAGARALRLGDPFDHDVHMGPIATASQLNRVQRMVTESVTRGATVLCGGQRATVEGLPGGFFFEPTVLSDVPADDPIAQEEVFGPVLTIFRFRNEEEAVALANGTRYGLAAGVWTRDVKRAHRMARRLRAGNVWINLYRAMTYNSPFGGYGASGNGHLNGVDAVNEFLQVKSVWVELSEGVRNPLILGS